MESLKEGYTNQDFRADPWLNQLMDTRLIVDCAVAWFKTFGSSRIWAHESEAPAYRDLILNEVTDEDRFRGRAWILSMAKVRGAIKESSGDVDWKTTVAEGIR